MEWLRLLQNQEVKLLDYLICRNHLNFVLGELVMYHRWHTEVGLLYCIIGSTRLIK